MNVAKQFCASPADRFDTELAYDKVLLDGFVTCLGQLIHHKVIQKEFNPKVLGIQSSKNVDATDFIPNGVTDNELKSSEFAGVVAEEEENYKFHNGCPYLPKFMSECLKKDLFSLMCQNQSFIFIFNS